ncbi:ATP-binding protein [Phenylobacterium sp.]|jgi:serine/threonine-protein kinase RsbW|uniref:ATP-binding protein n=1 Tax=Phenylobacterium sp. TaxID=1871053 RepID=UPI002EDA34B9
MAADFSHTLSGGRTGLPTLLDALEAHLLKAGASMSAVSAVMVAADEVLSNALDHSGAQAITVTAAVRGGRVMVEVADDGAPFDPTLAPAPDTSLPVGERQIGGLGVHLVRQLMDEVRYERVDGHNKLSFSKS